MSMTRLESVLATIGQQVDAAEAQIERAERMAVESERLRITGVSRDQLAEVVVDGVGQMVGLRFTGQAESAPLAELEAAVLEAHDLAKRRLSGEITRLGEEIYGPSSPAAETMAASYRDRFGVIEDEDDEQTHRGEVR